LRGDESEVALRRVAARDVCESGAGVERHASSDGIFWVDEAVVVDRDGSGALAPDDDPFGVPTEGSDVVSGPFNGTSLVEEADVLIFEAWRVGESENIHAVVER